MRVYVETLGCKVNQFESQAMESLLSERGHTLVTAPEACDAFVLNTCAVTAEGERKVRQRLRHLLRVSGGAAGAVCGCWSQLHPEEALALGAKVVTGSSGHVWLIEALEGAAAGAEAVCRTDEPLRRRCFEPLPSGKPAERTRSMMKIQDGCSNFCSYCIIPYTRGPVRSLPPEDCAAEAARLAENGAKEIVVTGIEAASYGRDLRPRITLAEAVGVISAAAPGCRLRLGSLEPRLLTEEFCEKIAAQGSVCPHFHVSLQSGCDATLKRMNRKYTAEAFYEACERLRRHFPGCALGTDVITGFPGETQEEFEETLAFLRRCGFAFLHAFPYSERPGTPACSLPGSVPKAVREERAREVIALGHELGENYRRAQIGRVLTVLAETQLDGLWTGHAENYCEVTFPGGRRGAFSSVRITGTEDGRLTGLPVEPA